MVNPVTVNIFAFLCNCKPVSRASDSFIFNWLRLDLIFSAAWSFRVQLVVFVCSNISVVLFDTKKFPDVKIRYF